MTVIPAYGRDYKSRREVLEAWEADKDFQIQDIGSRYNGSYINKSQAEGLQITVRYDRLRKTMSI